MCRYQGYSRGAPRCDRRAGHRAQQARLPDRMAIDTASWTGGGGDVDVQGVEQVSVERIAVTEGPDATPSEAGVSGAGAPLPSIAY